MKCFVDNILFIFHFDRRAMKLANQQRFVSCCFMIYSASLQHDLLNKPPHFSPILLQLARQSKFKNTTENTYFIVE